MLLPASHLQAPGESSSGARSRGGGGWRTSDQQSQQPLQQSPALFTPQWGAAVRHKIQLQHFLSYCGEAQIHADGTEASARRNLWFWRQQFSRDGLNTSRFKVCPVSFWSRPLNPRPCWAYAQPCFCGLRDVRRHLKSSPSCSHHTKVGFQLHLFQVSRGKHSSCCMDWPDSLDTHKKDPHLLPSICFYKEPQQSQTLSQPASISSQKNNLESKSPQGKSSCFVLSWWWSAPGMANTPPQSFPLVMDCLSFRRHFPRLI